MMKNLYVVWSVISFFSVLAACSGQKKGADKAAVVLRT